MRPFAIVTDSTADLTPAQAEEFGVTVVPLSVNFGDETLPDGQLTQVEFFGRMRAMAPKLPTTSQPPMGAFVAAYEAALASADEVISVHISNKLSGTVESARSAAAQFAGRVHVFDSLSLSWGMTLQTLEAVKVARAGGSVAEALSKLERAREHSRLIVGLDSLDNLARGGRIGKVSAFLGAMFNLKITFRVADDGSFDPVGRDRGEKAALEHTLSWVAEQLGDRAAAFAVGHALSLERAERLATAVRERFGVTDLYVYEAGSTICTHTGTGWGIALMPAE